MCALQEVNAGGICMITEDDLRIMAHSLGCLEQVCVVSTCHRAILKSDTDPIEVWLVSGSNADSAMAQAPDQAAEAQHAQQQPQPSGESSQQPADTRIDMQQEQQQHQQQEAGGQQQQQVGAVRLQQGGSLAASAGERGGAMVAAGMTTPPARHMSPLFKTEDRPHLTGAERLPLSFMTTKTAAAKHG